MRTLLLANTILVLSMAVATAAAAWTRPAHMVSAAIAYDEIARTRPDLLITIAELLDAHPDRAPFEVAIDRSVGAERDRRMFLECARWPDDARRTAYDHPSWHLSASPVIAADATDATRASLAERRHETSGQALQGLTLNLGVMANTRATPSERALALCWVLHVVGDLHQPLHTAELYSAAYPEGDLAGSRQFVLDPQTRAPITLHWLWDDSVHRYGDAASVSSRAKALKERYPRLALSELKAPTMADTTVFAAREESYAIARSFAYGGELVTGQTEATAPPVPERYWRALRDLSERRVAVAGYRLADLVIGAVGEKAASRTTER